MKLRATSGLVGSKRTASSASIVWVTFRGEKLRNEGEEVEAIYLSTSKQHEHQGAEAPSRDYYI